MSDCIFCQIASGDIPCNIVYQDDEVIAFDDANPQAPVHILVIPRRHIPTLLETEPEDTLLLGKLQTTAVEIARRQGLSESGFRLTMNCLEGGGQAVFHIHLHLLGGRRMEWPPG